MLDNKYLADGETFLDPCCGSGSFLLSVRTNTPECLYGFDINPIARNYFSIKCKENSKIKKFKKINLKMKNLDAKYLKELCHFKAKYGRNDYK